jgi:four helix bundle protein
MNKIFLKLVRNFDIEKQDFSKIIPYLTSHDQPDLGEFTDDEIGKWNTIKTYWDLSRTAKPVETSRMWKDAHAYRFLVQWSNSVLLRIFIRKFTLTLPFKEHRTKIQLDDAGRSIVSNIEEGFRRPTTLAYLDFLGYSEGSLEELNGLIRQCLQDGFIKSIKGTSIKDLGIDLKNWNNFVKNPLNSSSVLYFPLERNRYNYRILKDIKGGVLTYEMFVEIINKTDFLLQTLVESLESKENREKKYYQVEKIRLGIRSRGI